MISCICPLSDNILLSLTLYQDFPSGLFLFNFASLYFTTYPFMALLMLEVIKDLHFYIFVAKFFAFTALIFM